MLSTGWDLEVYTTVNGQLRQLTVGKVLRHTIEKFIHHHWPDLQNSELAFDCEIDWRFPDSKRCMRIDWIVRRSPDARSPL